jgi:uncharacterized protein involved in exopolysaccharide biosynthesis
MQDTPFPDTHHAEDEISLLDLLTTVSSNLRLLVLGPVLAGLLALGICYLVTPTFESRSVLRFQSDNELNNDTVAALLGSTDLLLPLLSQTPWLVQNGSRSGSLDALRQRVQTMVNKKDGTVTLVTTAPTPEGAHTLQKNVITLLRQLTMPKGNRLAALQQQKTMVETTLAELDKVMPTLARQVAANTADSENAARTYSLLLQQRDASQRALQNILYSLQSFGDEVFAQAPTIPDTSVKPQKALIALLAALATGFVLLIWVFIRQALRNAAQNPQDAARLAAIRSNMARSVGFLRA